MTKIKSLLATSLATILLVGASLVAMPTTASAASAEVQTILAQTNQNRAANGLPPLVANTAMNSVSQGWAQQMAAEQNMYHNPNYSKQIPGGWSRAAENVAYGYSPDSVTTGWMNSPGHRANILGDYTDIGIGAYKDGNGRWWYVQNFGKYANTQVPTTRAPDAPAAPQLSNGSSSGSSITVVWTVPSNDGGSAVTGYELTLRKPNNTTTIVNVSSPFYEFTNLNITGNYTATVKARNAVGFSPASASSAPLNLSGQVTPTPGGTLNPATVNRISGADRFVVAANISAQMNPNGSDTVYVATGANFPDALSIAPVAGRDNSSLLLALPDQIPAPILAELKRLNPKNIVVVGGVNSINNSVFNQLKGIAPTSRIDGADRYQASSGFVIKNFAAKNTPVVYVTTGANFPDALSAASAAASKNAPVLLTSGTGAGGLDQSTRNALDFLKPSKVIIAGGPNSVNVETEKALKSYSGITSVTRLAGSDRFAASAAINREAFVGHVDTAFLATGLNFPDALAGAALAGAKGSPLYVTQTDCVPGAALDALATQTPTTVTLLGGTMSLGSGVQSLKRC